jgi:hypothetical protein
VDGEYYATLTFERADERIVQHADKGE